jgi:hypothetical protein
MGLQGHVSRAASAAQGRSGVPPPSPPSTAISAPHPHHTHTPTLTCGVLGAAAVPLDCDVGLVSHHVCVSHDESFPHHKACAGALTLGVVLPGQEVVRPACEVCVCLGEEGQRRGASRMGGCGERGVDEQGERVATGLFV